MKQMIDKDALVIGATGATGSCLVDVLLADPAYRSVRIFVRKPTGKQHAKLVEHVIDFSDLEACSDLIRGDVAFSCLGTTLKDAGSKEKQWAIDFEIPASFARIARQNGVHTFALVSAAGSSSKSKLFYSRMKGMLEDRIRELAFPSCVILRPGLLERPGSDRPMEYLAVRIVHFFNRIGLLRQYRPLPVHELAEELALKAKGQVI